MSSQFDMLKDYLAENPAVKPSGFDDIWAALMSGNEAKSVIKEIGREVLVGRTIYNVRFIDGTCFDITISPARKWV